MTRRSRLGAVVLAVTLVLLLASCANSTAPTAPSPSAAFRCEQLSEQEGPDQSPDQEPNAAVSWRELKNDMAKAIDAVDDYWAQHWTECFGSEYDPPEIWHQDELISADEARDKIADGDDDRALGPGLYSEGNRPRCDGEDLQLSNAAYCPDGHFVAWGEPLMREALGVGDGLVYLVVAHEWAHALQARMPRGFAETSDQKGELQADCLAAATLHGADQETKFQFQTGDAREVARSLVDLADETAWTEYDDHGDAVQRLGAYEAGRAGRTQRLFRPVLRVRLGLRDPISSLGPAGLCGCQPTHSGGHDWSAHVPPPRRSGRRGLLRGARFRAAAADDRAADDQPASRAGGRPAGRGPHVRAVIDNTEDAYREGGSGAVWGEFISLVMHSGPVPADGVPPATWPPPGAEEAGGPPRTAVGEAAGRRRTVLLADVEALHPLRAEGGSAAFRGSTGGDCHGRKFAGGVGQVLSRRPGRAAGSASGGLPR